MCLRLPAILVSGDGGRGDGSDLWALWLNFQTGHFNLTRDAVTDFALSSIPSFLSRLFLSCSQDIRMAKLPSRDKNRKWMISVQWELRGLLSLWWWNLQSTWHNGAIQFWLWLNRLDMCQMFWHVLTSVCIHLLPAVCPDETTSNWQFNDLPREGIQNMTWLGRSRVLPFKTCEHMKTKCKVESYFCVYIFFSTMLVKEIYKFAQQGITICRDRSLSDAGDRAAKTLKPPLFVNSREKMHTHTHTHSEWVREWEREAQKSSWQEERLSWGTELHRTMVLKPEAFAGNCIEICNTTLGSCICKLACLECYAEIFRRQVV